MSGERDPLNAENSVECFEFGVLTHKRLHVFITIGVFMAQTQMLTGNALTVKVWEKQGWIQSMQRTALSHLFKRGAVHFPEKLMNKNTSKGDNITFSYVGKLTGLPIGEGGTLDGNEEALSLQNMTLAINVSRFGVLNPNEDTIEQQRTEVEFSPTTRKLLAKRAAELVDTSMFYQLAGANPTSLTINGTTYSTPSQLLHVQGNNSIIAPTTNRILWQNNQANDQSLTASDTMNLDIIDYALELNERQDQPMEPFDDDTYDLFMSPEQITDLKQNATAKIQWFNYALSQIIGDNKGNRFENRFEKNMICVGKYANVNLYMAPRVSYGVNSSSSAVITTVRRAVLVGVDALAYASPFGGRVTDKDVPLKLFTQLKDYDYYKGEEARLLYGLKKLSPTNKDDVGVTVLSTYAGTHL